MGNRKNKNHLVWFFVQRRNQKRFLVVGYENQYLKVRADESMKDSFVSEPCRSKDALEKSVYRSLPIHAQFDYTFVDMRGQSHPHIE